MERGKRGACLVKTLFNSYIIASLCPVDYRGREHHRMQGQQNVLDAVAMRAIRFRGISPLSR